MTQVSWISTMGYESIIEAVVDEKAHTVRVDAPTLIKMAHDTIDASIVGPEDSASFAQAILAIPVGPSGLYDVTEVGGGWQMWEDDRIVPDEDRIPWEPVRVGGSAERAATLDEQGSAAVKAAMSHSNGDALAALRVAFPLEYDEWRDEQDRAEGAVLVAAVVQGENVGFGSVTRAIETNERLLREQLPYTDHEGDPTSDPHCWLGLCVVCIDDALSRREAPPIPALSTHDPQYLTSQEYRDEVRKAYAAIGVTFRED